jgi:hypothetical protein
MLAGRQFMTNFQWRNPNSMRENFYIALAPTIAIAIYVVLISTAIDPARELAFGGVFVVAWVMFSTYRSRPRSISIEDDKLVFNNLGSYSLVSLQRARLTRLMGMEKVLELKIGNATGTLALHGVPDEIQLKLVHALNERIAR